MDKFTKRSNYGSINSPPDTPLNTPPDAPDTPPALRTPTKRIYLIVTLVTLWLAFALLALFSYLLEWGNTWDLFSNFLALILLAVLLDFVAENEINQKIDCLNAIVGLIASTVALVDGEHVVQALVIGSHMLLILEWFVIRKIPRNEQNQESSILIIMAILIYVLNSEKLHFDEIMDIPLFPLSILILCIYFQFTRSAIGVFLLLLITIVVVFFAKNLVGSIERSGFSKTFGSLLLPIVNNFVEIKTTISIFYYNRTPKIQSIPDSFMICIFMSIMAILPKFRPLEGAEFTVLLVAYIILRVYWQKVKKDILKNMLNVVYI